MEIGQINKIFDFLTFLTFFDFDLFNIINPHIIIVYIMLNGHPVYYYYRIM